MSNLLQKIRRLDSSAAICLEEADFRTDSDLQTLTREELHELFPGRQNLKKRRTIFDTIHTQKSIHLLLKELQDFIPHESLKAALTNNGVLVDYLHILKDMKTQLNKVQSVIDAHIDLLEGISKAQPEQQQSRNLFDGGYSAKQKSNLSGTPVSDLFDGGYSAKQKSNFSGTPVSGSAMHGWETSERTNTTSGQNKADSEKSTTSYGFGGLLSTFGFSHKSNVKGATESCSRFEGIRHKKQVKYKMVVSGKTFDAHLQILDRINSSGHGLNLVDVEKNQTGELGDVTFVFCPNVSRVGTDIEAAMKEVRGSGPVVLVLMHHSHEAKHVASVKTWAESFQILLHVNVFYHDKSNGLIACKENEEAISAIRDTLQSCSSY